MASCKNDSKKTEDKISVPKPSVQVTNITYSSVNDELTLFGNTMYLKRNVVTSPIPAFIIEVNAKLGDKVNQGDVLYVLQSKESRALGNAVSKIDSTLSGFGIIKVKAPASGIISTLDKQQAGDYVLEGTQLCTIAESNDLVVQVNVPYEFVSYAKLGNNCTLILPDNSIQKAIFSKALTTMNALAQTQSILAKPKANLFLPENMVVKVVISKSNKSNRQVLPKSCVLSDEMMKEFWVMKILNDSTAIRQNVVTGNSDEENIEIISPMFNSTDKIIIKGNYGLPDTTLVAIKNTNAK